jgi:hypothetical protein
MSAQRRPRDAVPAPGAKDRAVIPHARLAPPTVFYGRLGRSVLASLALVAVTLAIGTLGYRRIANMAWIDAFHQASLLMSGMGPLEESGWSSGAKLFDSLYALFCGMVLLLSTGVLFAPILHRLVHKFHLEDAQER